MLFDLRSVISGYVYTNPNALEMHFFPLRFGVYVLQKLSFLKALSQVDKFEHLHVVV